MRSEFQFIQHIKDRYRLSLIGDDGAVLPKDDRTDTIVTTDMLVEDIDFRLDWTSPELLGHKALAVSLSDIAAMGARPKWAMLSIAVPEEQWRTDFLDEFYEGWYLLASKFAVELVGGDVSRAPGKLVIDSIVGGEVQKGQAVVRSGAKAGDVIAVSGCLGGAAAGLQLLESGEIAGVAGIGPKFELIQRQLCPEPKVELGMSLAEKGISAMIDISDGLSSDLAHICEASDVGAVIDASKIPSDPNLSALGLSDERNLDRALSGGEDFELLFTLGKDVVAALGNEEITVIGEITANVGIIELVREGKAAILEPTGFQHFR